MPAVELNYVIQPPFYPIVYVRGFSPTAQSREGNFHDLYYGYADTSVELRPKSPADSQTPETDRIVLDLFEGQMIRCLKEFAYVDASHGGLQMAIQQNTISRPQLNPTRSIWVSRFYDEDYLQGKVRTIDLHAQDLWDIINVDIRTQFEQLGVPMDNFKVILIAHSMGGLVCRTLIQDLLPKLGIDPKTIIHRFATLATPHGGVELGAIPDAFQNFVVNTFNPDGMGIFKSPMMRKYLDLEQVDGAGNYLFALNSLGDPASPYAFPIGRCFCVIGSDHQDYGIVQQVTGGYSDGLVKQDLAFLQGAFTANVHRSHSGYRGIVNSFESYENVHRFLFGDTMVQIHLDDIVINGTHAADAKDFYDFEFVLSVRNTGVYLHQRQEDPCENAYRYVWNEIPAEMPLHTAFLSTLRRSLNEVYMYFELSFRVVEHRVAKGLLWDQEYPSRAIYSESLEIRVNNDGITGEGPNSAEPPVQYQWLADGSIGSQNWQTMTETDGSFVFDLRPAPALSGKLRLTPAVWDDAAADARVTVSTPAASPAPVAGPAVASPPSLLEKIEKALHL